MEGVREFVHQHIPLDDVLRGVRIGHAATTEAFLRACAELVDPEVAVEEVTAVSRELFSYVDELSDTMITTYLVEHEVWSTSAAAARADVVRSLLLDDATVDVAEASRALGYDLARTHEAVTVWSDSPDSGAKLQATALKVLRARGATTTLVGALAVRSEPMEALRTTLYHYLDAERSLVDVAGRLFVAKGTVTYRVKRAQELLGHDLDDRRFALYSALALAEELGDTVLQPGDAHP